MSIGRLTAAWTALTTPSLQNPTLVAQTEWETCKDMAHVFIPQLCTNCPEEYLIRNVEEFDGGADTPFPALTDCRSFSGSPYPYTEQNEDCRNRSSRPAQNCFCLKNTNAWYNCCYKQRGVGCGHTTPTVRRPAAGRVHTKARTQLAAISPPGLLAMPAPVSCRRALW